MCGFIGLFSKNIFISKDIPSLRQSLISMSHRGPDGSGEFVSDYFYLGHVRLQIIDLHTRSNQPFIDKKSGNVLVFNGEIYNFEELKSELLGAGIIFYTESDTEVLLHGFGYWGVYKTLKKLDGMFSGAFYDKNSNSTYLFRDPFGQKPLYWYQDEDYLLFSSELRGIINVSINKKRWKFSNSNFLRYLFNGYYGSTDTPLENVFKLRPGYCLLYQEGIKQYTQYFVQNNFNPNLNRTLSDSVDELDALIKESCHQSLQADVPQGVFLSGGIDSSILLRYCKKIQPDILALSVSMSELDYDEIKKAKQVVEHLNIKNFSSFILDEKKIVDLVKIVLNKMDEPHGDPGLINAYFLCENSRNFIKVGISGDGGDELFAGYESFKAINLAKLFNKFGLFKNISNLLISNINGGDGYLDFQFKLNSFMKGVSADRKNRMAAWLATIAPNNFKHLIKLNKATDIESIEISQTDSLFFNYLQSDWHSLNDLQISLLFYQTIFLPEFICMHSDRASMLNGMESRAPFLSTKIAIFANSLTDSQKIHGFTTKIILRELAKKLNLPYPIYRQKKHGFTFPIARWMKTTLKPLVDELIKDDRFFNLVNINKIYVEELASDHQLGKSNNYRILYCLIASRIWVNNYSEKIDWFEH